VKAPKLTIKAADKCSVCGQPLPADERGVPVTSLWKMGKWYCHNCKFKTPEQEQSKK